MNQDPKAWARLGQALRIARDSRGLTQDELAELAGVSARSVQEAEAGKMPRARMPYTLGPIATALHWPPGTVEDVLDGGDPPGSAGWKNVPVPQPQLDAEQLAGVMTNAMVRATEHVTAAEIRAATKIALDELRRHGYLVETNSAQPSTNGSNT